jgi:hypothetical protein
VKEASRGKMALLMFCPWIMPICLKIKEKYLQRIQPEGSITQEERQVQFDNYQTTDDHGMQIVGLYTDQNGKEYYKVKNSWGEKMTLMVISMSQRISSNLKQRLYCCTKMAFQKIFVKSVKYNSFYNLNYHNKY